MMDLVLSLWPPASCGFGRPVRSHSGKQRNLSNQRLCFEEAKKGRRGRAEEEGPTKEEGPKGRAEEEGSKRPWASKAASVA